MHGSRPGVVGGSGQGRGWRGCPVAPSSLLPALGVFKPCCSTLVISWAFYAFLLRTAIFLTFTVVEEGMEISVETVTGSVKP